MCGIVGIAGADRPDESVLKRMCDVIVHRGPDDYGVHIDSNVGIAMRRLSIIDPATGHQPIMNEDGSVAVVCNGEIYNFTELREDLEKKGHIFKTNSDVEVLVHLYEEHGEGCLDRLNGMFAFIIWDSRERTLFVARDRMGVKPLYYTFQKGRLVLASELKSILEVKDLNFSTSYRAVDMYLQYQFIPGPLTIFKEVKKLLPGHFIKYRGGSMSISRYWDISYDEKSELTDDEAASELYELLNDSVGKRLVSDVPFGAFLSGGIDSSAVVCSMSKILSQPVKTFSIGFEGSNNDELQYARKVARLYNTDHHEYIVKPPDVEEIIPKLVDSFDEPFADSSAIPTYVVSEMASRHVKMVLSGDGGDESFAGYRNYQYYSMVERAQAKPEWLKQLAHLFSNSLPDMTTDGSYIRKFKRFVSQMKLTVPEQWMASRSQFSPWEKNDIYSQEFRDCVDGEEPFDQLGEYFNRSIGWDVVDRFLFYDLKTYMVDDILVKVDRMSMANSIEVRSPFLDYRVAEFASRLRPGLKLKNLLSKYVLKMAFREELPKEILFRKKQGFSMPLDSWLKTDLVDYASGLLFNSDSRVRWYFSDKFVDSLIRDHVSGVKNNSGKIWMLVILELWHKRHP